MTQRTRDKGNHTEVVFRNTRKNREEASECYKYTYIALQIMGYYSCDFLAILKPYPTKQHNTKQNKEGW